MNFGFTEEQEFLRTTAREFLEQQCPMTRVRELMEGDLGHDPALWKQMAELGWLGLLLPEEYGGADLTFVDLVVVLEEMGRSLVPTPFFGHLLGTLALLEAGTDAEKKELLTPAAAGDHLLTFAITEDAGTENASELSLRADKSGDAYTLNGTKLFVPDAAVADTLIVLARTGGTGGDAEGGFSLLRVSKDAPGLVVTPLKSMDMTRRIAEVRFEDTPGTLLGPENGGWAIWERLRDAALLALSADALGGAEKVLEDSVKYAKANSRFCAWRVPVSRRRALPHGSTSLPSRLTRRIPQPSECP